MPTSTLSSTTTTFVSEEEQTLLPKYLEETRCLRELGPEWIHLIAHAMDRIDLNPHAGAAPRTATNDADEDIGDILVQYGDHVDSMIVVVYGEVE
ncbi:hypothetical protein HK102_008986, partial [Quaeritorhiza haematococci]